MALRSTWSGLTDDDILVLGKFLLAVNALDVAMENAIMRYWQIGDRSRFREVFFERIATGDKKRLLQKSLDDASHKDHFKAIDDAIEKRNIIAHRLPITEWVVDDWDKGGEALDAWPVARIGPVSRQAKPTSFDELSAAILNVQASRTWVDSLYYESVAFRIEIPKES